MPEEKPLIQPISQFKAYNRLWTFLNETHGLVLINSEIDDLVVAIQEFIKEFNEEEDNSD
jgi:hypothetical protein